MKSKDPEVAKLQSKIELYNMSIEDDPIDPKAYSLKADALLKIGKITKESSCHEEALKCYNKAIELDPENPLYFAGRSKLYIEMGNPELAVEDIKQVKNLPQNSNAMTSIYLKQVVESIAKLDSVQSTIQKLQKNGKIDSELANALTEHTKVMANLVAQQVGSHDERLDVHDQEIGSLHNKTDEIIAIVRVLSEGRQVDAAQIARLTQDTGVLKEKVEQNSIKLQGIEEQLHRTVVTMTEAIKASKISDADKEAMNVKLEVIENQLSSLAKQKDVSKIVLDMKKMMGENKFTKESLEDLQAQVDEMREMKDTVQNNTVTIRMLNEVTYDNSLLNHPNLLKSLLQQGSIYKALHLSQGLSEGLIGEAAANNDTELLLAGLESLGYHHASQ